jgi:hypothetical protein
MGSQCVGELIELGPLKPMLKREYRPVSCCRTFAMKSLEVSHEPEVPAR